MIVRCLSVNVYRNSIGDCTNGGVSSRFDTLLVACPDGSVTFDSDVETPLNFCMVERRRICSVYGSMAEPVHLRIVPACVDESGQIVKRPGWWMNGGNIADTADSRFSRMNGHYYPLTIHDRQE